MQPLRIISTSILLVSSLLYSQQKGDFFICYGFEFPSGGYLALRYFPADRIGVEIYSSAMWNIFNYGARLEIHTSADKIPDTFISIGYTHISAYNPGAVFDTSDSSPMFVSRSMSGVDLGIGRETVTYDGNLISFEAGPTYVLNLEDTFYDLNRNEATMQPPPIFSYYFIGTILAQLPEKDPDPIRIP